MRIIFFFFWGEKRKNFTIRNSIGGKVELVIARNSLKALFPFYENAFTLHI